MADGFTARRIFHYLSWYVIHFVERDWIYCLACDSWIYDHLGFITFVCGLGLTTFPFHTLIISSFGDFVNSFLKKVEFFIPLLRKWLPTPYHSTRWCSGFGGGFFPLSQVGR